MAYDLEEYRQSRSGNPNQQYVGSLKTQYTVGVVTSPQVQIVDAKNRNMRPGITPAAVMQQQNINILNQLKADIVQNRGNVPNIQKIMGAALKNADGNAAMTNQIVTTALKETGGKENAVDRAAVMIAMVDKDPAWAAKTLHDLGASSATKDLVSLQGADLRPLGKLAERLPFNQINVMGATLAANLDLRKNPFMDGAHLEGVIAPQANLPGRAKVHVNENTKIRQQVVDVNLINSKADHGHTHQLANAWDFKTGSAAKLESALQATNTQKVTKGGMIIQKDNKKSAEWAGVLGISDKPSAPG